MFFNKQCKDLLELLEYGFEFCKLKQIAAKTMGCFKINDSGFNP